MVIKEMTMDKKILVIEDDPATLRLVDYSFRHKGYQVLTASNGLEGMRKARNEKPALIILDVMLPGMDGFEICHRLRSEPDTAQTLILMFSAKAQEIDRDTGLKVGADDYITKPVDPGELVNRVESLLARKTGARTSAGVPHLSA
jgi:two-component system alkaline phosphatase synthesis response regulator PhoP